MPNGPETSSPEPHEVQAIVVGGPGTALDRLAEANDRSYRSPVNAYLVSLSTEKSRRTAIESMRRIARILGVQKDPRDHGAWNRIPWTSLTYAETNMVRAALISSGAKPATTRLTLSVLKRVLEEAFKLELIGAEQYQRAVLLQPVKGQSARPGRELVREDMERLEKHLSGLEEPLRSMVRALFAVGIGAGLRREELARLLLEGVQGRELHFVGKGMKAACQRIEPWALEALSAWLAVRADTGFKVPNVFVRYDEAGDVLVDAPMKPEDVWRLVTSQARAAGIPKITTHDLRRTFITRIIREKDPLLAKQAARHVNMATTERYDRRGDDALEEALGTMSPMMGEVKPPPKTHWIAFEVFFRARLKGDPAKAGPRVVAAFLARQDDWKAAWKELWPMISTEEHPWDSERVRSVQVELRRLLVSRR